VRRGRRLKTAGEGKLFRNPKANASRIPHGGGISSLKIQQIRFGPAETRVEKRPQRRGNAECRLNDRGTFRDCGAYYGWPAIVGLKSLDALIAERPA